MEKAELRTLGVLITKVGYAAILTAIVDDLDEESRIADHSADEVALAAAANLLAPVAKEFERLDI